MMKEIIASIIGSVAGSITSELVKPALDKNKEDEKRELTFKDRPEMAIIDYKDYTQRVGYGVKKKCDIELFVARIDKVDVEGRVKAVYRKEDFNKKEWCCVIYTLKNAGKTDVSILDIISCNKGNTCVFPCADAEDWASKELLNYSKTYDKKIYVGETITLKLCYHKESILSGIFFASIIIGMRDSNKHYWQQAFFCTKRQD